MPPEHRAARVMVGLGCFMIIGVPLVAVASCAVSSSAGDPQPSVSRTATPAANHSAPPRQASTKSPQRLAPKVARNK